MIGLLANIKKDIKDVENEYAAALVEADKIKTHLNILRRRQWDLEGRPQEGDVFVHTRKGIRVKLYIIFPYQFIWANAYQFNKDGSPGRLRREIYGNEWVRENDSN